MKRINGKPWRTWPDHQRNMPLRGLPDPKEQAKAIMEHWKASR